MTSIRFADEDLARIRVAQSPSLPIEILLSLRVLTYRPEGCYALWRASTHARLGLPVGRTSPVDALREIVRSAASTSDAVRLIADGIRPWCQVPHPGAEPAPADAPATSAGSTDGLVEGPGPVTATAHATGPAAELVRYCRAAIMPYWDQFRVAVETERAAHARALLNGGPDQLLHTLGPGLRWAPPQLSSSSGDNGELSLPGGGVILVPSVFCLDDPLLVETGEGQPLLVYPMDASVRTAALAMPDHRAARTGTLENLLGRTRAAILTSLSDAYTTTEVARRHRLAPGTVSKHLSVLREARLVESRRLANEVLYMVTPLGRAVVRSAARNRPPPAAPEASVCPSPDGESRQPCSTLSRSTASTSAR